MAKKIYNIKNGQLVTAKKTAPNPKKILSSYEAYQEEAKSIGIKPRSQSSFNTAIAGERAKGRIVSGRELARREAQLGYTNKEIRARWHAAQKMGYNMPRKEFIKSQAYVDVDDTIAEAYARLKEENPGLETWQISRMISIEIFDSK